MSRTPAGNLTGKAAQTERRDLMERIEDDRRWFSDDWKNSIAKLASLLDDNAFDAWWDSYPEQISKGDFLPIIKSKIAELDKQPDPVQLAHGIEDFTACDEDGCGNDDLYDWARGG